MTNKQLLEFFGDDFLVALLAVRKHYLDSMPAKPTEEQMKLFRYWLRVDHLVELLKTAVDERNESTL